MNEIQPRPHQLQLSGRLYVGTVAWLIASFALGWLPLLWINNWSPPNIGAVVLLVALFSILGLVTLGWWFLVGWCFALTARMRRNAILLGALAGGIGIVTESAVQLGGQFGATGGDDPGIGDLLVVPFVPVIVGVAILLITGAGFYVHAFRETRPEPSP